MVTGLLDADPQLEYRAFDDAKVELIGDVADVDSRSHQVKIVFPHETTDSFKTQFGPDAFTAGFKRRYPAFVYQHNLKDPIGKCLSAQSLREHNEIVNKFSDLDKVPSAARAFAQIEDGSCDNFSFGYTDGPEVPHPDRGLRAQGVMYIPSVFMRETSPVTIGSIPGARATGLRQIGDFVVVEDPELIVAMVRAEIIKPEDANTMLQRLGVLQRSEEMTTTADDLGLSVDELALASRALKILAERGDPAVRSLGDPIGGMPTLVGTTSGTDAMAHAQRAKDHAAEAVGAANAGDIKKAHHHASESRRAARMAAESASPDTPADTTAAAEAGQAASTASAAADDAEQSQAGAQWEEHPETAMRAENVLAVIQRADPKLHAALLSQRAQVVLAPPDLQILFRAEDGTVATVDGSALAPDSLDLGGDDDAMQLIGEIDAAHRSIGQYLEGIDLGELPDEIQQAFALVQAASVGSRALCEITGVEADSGERALDTSDSDWDPQEGDYSPAQWKSACLVDTGEGDEDDKARYKLPVKEPDGKHNRHGIAAAASRINELKGVPDEAKRGAAKQLMSLYGQMKQPVPPNVLKVAGKGGERADQEAVDADFAAAAERLEKLGAGRPA